MFKLVKKTVSRKGALHFRRWAILETPWFNIYLHHLLKSDEDKDFHDHGWPFTSIILKGGYIEHSPTGSRTYTVGRIIEHAASDPHKIELLEPTWTLVFTGKHRGFWGYHTPEGWVHHKIYRILKHSPKFGTFGAISTAKISDFSTPMSRFKHD